MGRVECEVFVVLISEECEKGLMIDVVKRETAGALISSSCMLGVTMISHTFFPC